MCVIASVYLYSVAVVTISGGNGNLSNVDFSLLCWTIFTCTGVLRDSIGQRLRPESTSSDLVNSHSNSLVNELEKLFEVYTCRGEIDWLCSGGVE